jgi:hypothetical protein
MAYTALSDFVVNQLFGYQSATRIKNNVEAILAIKLTKDLGGSRDNSVIGTPTIDIPEYRDVALDSTKLGGLSVRARVEVKTANAGTSVTPKIRNMTDSTDKVVGTASTSLTFVEQLLVMTPLTAGDKKYRLQLNTNNGTNDVFGFGVVELYA